MTSISKVFQLAPALCKLPQKQYKLKVERSIKFKLYKNEEKQIYPRKPQTFIGYYDKAIHKRQALYKIERE